MNASALPLDPPSMPAEFRQCFDLQRSAYLAQPAPAYAERLADLETLTRLLKENREALIDAINRDYGNRSSFVTCSPSISR